MTASLGDKQRRSFDQLVEEGVYSEDFEHAPAAKDFVGAVLAQAMPQSAPGRPLAVLDSGCGTRAWLAFAASTLRPVGMAEVWLCGLDRKSDGSVQGVSVCLNNDGR